MDRAEENNPPKQNVHSAVSPDDCLNMGRRNGWNLLWTRENDDPILSTDCFFEGEQTSFEDTRYDGNDE